MRTTLLALSLACALGAPLASAADGQRPDVGQQAGRLQPKVLAWRRDSPPAPGAGQPRNAHRRKVVADHLRSLGLEREDRHRHHRRDRGAARAASPARASRCAPTWTRCRSPRRNGLPFASKATSTFRGETVGVMHACGHDAHTGILMGVAEALVAMKADLPGEVLFDVPARRGRPAGWRRRRRRGNAEAGHLPATSSRRRCSACTCSARSTPGSCGYRGGPLMAASDRFNIMIKGRQTHGSRPWGGVDPIVAAADVIGTCADDCFPPPEHLEAAGRRHLRRDQGRHPLQHHSRPGGNDRHHPHLRRRHARRRCSPTCRTWPNMWPPRTAPPS